MTTPTETPLETQETVTKPAFVAMKRSLPLACPWSCSACRTPGTLERGSHPVLIPSAKCRVGKDRGQGTGRSLVDSRGLNLLRHLKNINKNLSWKGTAYPTWPWCGRVSPRGNQEKAVGSSRGGNYNALGIFWQGGQPTWQSGCVWSQCCMW